MSTNIKSENIENQIYVVRGNRNFPIPIEQTSYNFKVINQNFHCSARKKNPKYVHLLSHWRGSIPVDLLQLYKGRVSLCSCKIFYPRGLFSKLRKCTIINFIRVNILMGCGQIFFFWKQKEGFPYSFPFLSVICSFLYFVMLFSYFC